jgi:hypothetical protein
MLNKRQLLSKKGHTIFSYFSDSEQQYPRFSGQYRTE